MDVTVVIVTWNSQDLIKKCLQHLQQQTVTPRRVIVLDNDSSDQTVSIVREFSYVDVLCMSSNLGFAAGNNTAIRQCDTEWIALLNPDAFPEERWLEALYEATINNPDTNFFGSLQLCESETSMIDGIGDSYHFSGVAWREAHGKKHTKELLKKEIFSPCAAAALYKRETFNLVGGFDEDYFCYMEDVDLGFRLRLAGQKALFVPDAIVHHVGSASTGGQHSDFSIYHGHRNLVWTYIKNMPGFLFWFCLPIHILMNVITLIWFSIRGQGKVIFKAKVDAIKKIPREWGKRKKLQANRSAAVSDIWQVLSKNIFQK